MTIFSLLKGVFLLFGAIAFWGGHSPEALVSIVVAIYCRMEEIE